METVNFERTNKTRRASFAVLRSLAVNARCPDCGCESGKVRYFKQTFQYGVVPNTVTLQANALGWECSKCRLLITGGQAERARDAAVKVFLDGSDHDV